MASKTEKEIVIRLWLKSLEDDYSQNAKKFWWWMCKESKFFTKPHYARVTNAKLLEEIRELSNHSAECSIGIDFYVLKKMLGIDWGIWEYNLSGIWVINDHNVSTTRRDKSKDKKFTKKMAKGLDLV